MRRFPVLLVAAAAALTVVPVSSALADTSPHGESAGSCPAPEVTRDYDSNRYAVQVSLLATGCAAREHRQFPLTVFVNREDGNSGEGVGRVVVCGPFRFAADLEPGDAPARYSCDVDMAFDHPPIETARYDVEVTYPGADGDETLSLVSDCLSAGATASCSDEAK